MSKTSSAPPAPETSLERLSAAVTELSQNVRVLTDLVQETRETLQWIADNGVPHQTLTVRIDPQSSVIPPAGDDGPWKVQVTEVEDPAARPVTEQGLQDACDWLADQFGELAQEQLNLLVTAQNGVKREILAAIAGQARVPPTSSPRSAPPNREIPSASAAVQPCMPPTNPDRPVVHQPRQFLFDQDPPLPETLTDAVDHTVPVIPSTLKHTSAREITLWEIGDAVEFSVDGRELWGEIVALHDAENTATVQLIPSGEEVIISQEGLQSERASVRGEKAAYRPTSPEPDASNSDLERESAAGPVTLATFVSVRHRLEQGTIQVEELRRVFARCRAERREFIIHLTSRLKLQQLRAFAAALRCLDPGRSTKETLAMRCYQALLQTFAVGRPPTATTSLETEEGIIDSVARLTDDDLRHFAATVRGDSPPPPQFEASAVDHFLTLLSRIR